MDERNEHESNKDRAKKERKNKPRKKREKPEPKHERNEETKIRGQKSRKDTYSESSSTVGSVCAERVAVRCVARALADLYDQGSVGGRSMNAELRCGDRRGDGCDCGGDDCGEPDPPELVDVDADETEVAERDASSHS